MPTLITQQKLSENLITRYVSLVVRLASVLQAYCSCVPKACPEDSAQIPVTLDPNLRLISDPTRFVSAIQTTHPMIGKDCMPSDRS